MSRIRQIVGLGLFGGVSTYAYSRGYFSTSIAYAQGSTNKQKIHFDFSKPLLDLRDREDLTLQELQQISDGIAHSKDVRHVKWPDNFDQTVAKSPVDSKKLKEAKESIEIQLARYHQKHPSDFIHALLSSHVYLDSKDADKVKFPSNTSKSKYDQYVTDWQVQKVYNVQEAGRYYAVSYVNKGDQQLVLSFRGTTLEKNDILATVTPLSTDLVGVFGGKIVSQIAQTYVTTKDAATFAKALSNELCKFKFGHLDSPIKFDHEVSHGYIPVSDRHSPFSCNIVNCQV